MIKSILIDWIKQYIPILINSICTAICLGVTGCKISATDLRLQIDYPATYHSNTNTVHN